MEQAIVASYVKAGKITAEARSYGAKLIKPGASVLGVCQAVEKKIRELGGEPAFPVQIAINHVAAHFCPDPDDTLAFKHGDICKLDLGVHIDGYIADTAITVDLGEHAELLKASKEACEAALKEVEVGVCFGELGRAIHEVITSYGFAPVRNLSGHGLDRYVIHDNTITVPNYDNRDKKTIQPGMAFAIEPFATDGQGLIQEQAAGNIYSQLVKKPVRNAFARKVQDEIAKYKSLPFTTHWLSTPQKAAEMGLRELYAAGAVHCYPPLTEVERGLVSQHEHTVIITDDGKAIVTTKDF